MFNLMGVASLILLLMIVSSGLATTAFTGVSILENQETSAEVDRLIPQAYNEWTTTIASEVQAQGQSGTYAAPGTQQFSMCDDSNPGCGETGTVDFNGGFGSGSATDTFTAVQQGTGVYCPVWSEAQRTATAKLTVTNRSGSVLGSRNVTFISRLTCGAPYVASTTVNDDSGRALYGNGVARVGDTGGGCDPSNPNNCDNLTSSYGATSVSDTREHAALECAGVYCTGSDGLRSVDNFQTQTTTNAAESSGQPR